jgi:hypothetical protein
MQCHKYGCFPMAQILLSTTQEKFLGILDIPLFYEVNNTNLIIEGNEDYNALLNIKRQLFKNILGRSVNSV